MARLDRTAPRISHRLPTSNPIIPAIETRPIATTRLLFHSLVHAKAEGSYGSSLILARQIPGLKIHFIQSQRTFRWAREVIGPKDLRAKRINKALLINRN